MRKTEIYTVQESDRNIFFVYECEDKMELKKNLVGLNFHYGADDLDVSYAENDTRLFKIYLEEMERTPVGHKFNKIAVAERAIEIFMIKNNEAEREAIIKKQVEIAIENLFTVCHTECYTIDGFTTMEQHGEINEIQERLQKLIMEQVTQNL